MTSWRSMIRTRRRRGLLMTPWAAEEDCANAPLLYRAGMFDTLWEYLDPQFSSSALTKHTAWDVLYNYRGRRTSVVESPPDFQVPLERYSTRIISRVHCCVLPGYVPIALLCSRTLSPVGLLLSAVTPILLLIHQSHCDVKCYHDKKITTFPQCAIHKTHVYIRMVSSS